MISKDTISKDTLQKISQKDGQNLAYQLRIGLKPVPTLVFLGGYRSDMTGTKATHLDEWAATHDVSLLRFDYRGHGASDGDFRDYCIGDWLDDALLVIDTLTTGDIILIGSSMGGWIGLLVAKLRAGRIKGFIGIAAAPDFTDWVWNNNMIAAERALCKIQGYINTPDGDTLTYKIFEDGAQHLVFDKPLNLPFPVTLLQGKKDSEVPYQLAQKLAAHITPNPATLVLVDDGDHRLSRKQDLDMLDDVLEKLMWE